MKRKQIFTILVVAGIAVSLTFMASTYGSKQVPVIDKTAQIARGKYMVTIGGCHDCHTPWIIGADGKPGPDMSRALSGHPASFPITRQAKLDGDRWGYAGAATNTAFSGPWGVSFAANLSPDRMTGTGIWTPEIFRNTIRNGRHWGVARPLLPPMPWFNYRHMTDEDLNAVFAYIHTLKPVHNEVPAPLPPTS
jgi:mono/diheme cytochrome c family protein